MEPGPDPTAASLRSTFDSRDPLTVGIEEELFLLDPQTLDLAPEADAALALTGGDPRFKGELPAAQLEIATEPAATVGEALERLAEGRRDLVQALDGRWLALAAGAHPFAAAEGVLSEADRYAPTRERYGRDARLQLVSALQVHVAVGAADRALAVHDALRSYLPELLALGANSRWYEGQDSGFASVRARIAELLPRQGVPPRLGSWEEYAAALSWGRASGAFPAAQWWWELRPHPALGTLEVRVADAQASLDEAAGVVALVVALVADLAMRHEAGEALPVHPRWRIEEARWYAAREGLEARLPDLHSGRRRPVRETLRELVERVRGAAAECAAEHHLDRTLALIEANGSDRQLLAGANGGAMAVAADLAARFRAGVPG